MWSTEPSYRARWRFSWRRRRDGGHDSHDSHVCSGASPAHCPPHSVAIDSVLAFCTLLAFIRPTLVQGGGGFPYTHHSLTRQGHNFAQSGARTGRSPTTSVCCLPRIAAAERDAWRTSSLFQAGGAPRMRPTEPAMARNARVPRTYISCMRTRRKGSSSRPHSQPSLAITLAFKPDPTHYTSSKHHVRPPRRHFHPRLRRPRRRRWGL